MNMEAWKSNWYGHPANQYTPPPSYQPQPQSQPQPQPYTPPPYTTQPSYTPNYTTTSSSSSYTPPNYNSYTSSYTQYGGYSSNSNTGSNYSGGYSYGSYRGSSSPAQPSIIERIKEYVQEYLEKCKEAKHAKEELKYALPFDYPEYHVRVASTTLSKTNTRDNIALGAQLYNELRVLGSYKVTTYKSDGRSWSLVLTPAIKNLSRSRRIEIKGTQLGYAISFVASGEKGNDSTLGIAKQYNRDNCSDSIRTIVNALNYINCSDKIELANGKWVVSESPLQIASSTNVTFRNYSSVGHHKDSVFTRCQFQNYMFMGTFSYVTFKDCKVTDSVFCLADTIGLRISGSQSVWDHNTRFFGQIYNAYIAGSRFLCDLTGVSDWYKNATFETTDKRAAKVRFGLSNWKTSACIRLFYQSLRDQESNNSDSSNFFKKYARQALLQMTSDRNKIKTQKNEIARTFDELALFEKGTAHEGFRLISPQEVKNAFWSQIKSHPDLVKLKDKQCIVNAVSCDDLTLVQVAFKSAESVGRTFIFSFHKDANGQHNVSKEYKSYRGVSSQYMLANLWRIYDVVVAL